MSDAGAPVRLDTELVRRGQARSRTQATALVRQGRVRVDGVPVTKAATPVEVGQLLTVDTEGAPGYVSRAARKLAGALDALGPRGPVVRDVECVDVGASTGGFTDVLLRRGARRVLAIDVGHGQLVDELAADPRVDVREGLNARDLDRSHVPTPPGLLVADLSFISLRTVLPALAGVCDARTDLLLMVKPQFEVGRERLGRGGVVRSAALRSEAVAAVGEDAGRRGMGAIAVVPSPLAGPSGNREYFVWLRPGHRSRDVGPAARAAAAWEPGSGPVPVVWIAGPPAVPGGEVGVQPETLVTTNPIEGDS